MLAAFFSGLNLQGFLIKQILFHSNREGSEQLTVQLFLGLSFLSNSKTVTKHTSHFRLSPLAWLLSNTSSDPVSFHQFPLFWLRPNFPHTWIAVNQLLPMARNSVLIVLVHLESQKQLVLHPLLEQHTANNIHPKQAVTPLTEQTLCHFLGPTRHHNSLCNMIPDRQSVLRSQ